jgi:hypothetical protein
MFKWILLLSVVGLGVLIYRQLLPDIQRYMRIRNM